MRWNIIAGLARTEARLTRRLVRYWVFLILTTIFVVGSYFYYAAIHAFLSSYSASVSSISPRHLISAFGFWGMALFVVGLNFLAFDVRARDERERIVEVLDSRPCTNLELVAGRFLGLLLMSWLPIVIMTLGIQLFGWIAHSNGWVLGEPMVPWSLAAFLIAIALPALTFTLGLVFLVSFLTNNRLITAVVSLGFLAGMIFLLFRVPFDMIPVVDLYGAYTLGFSSDLVPGLFSSSSLLQRGAVLLAGLGLLLLSARLHPRLDSGPKNLWAAAGVGLILVAVISMGFIYQQIASRRATFDEWRSAHRARAGESIPDLRTLSGQVSIDPGRALSVKLELEIAAPTDLSAGNETAGNEALESALFTLNPGLEVQAVSDGSGASLSFTHEQGLLQVALAQPLAAGESTRLTLAYQGRPNTDFAYLESALHIRDLKLVNANLILLGHKPSIFHSRYVALLPGIHWLPSAGADSGRDAGDQPRDFFDLTLDVDVPQDWLVAGPGRRRPADGAENGQRRFHFAPPAALPEAALVASRFESRKTEVAGVELELLLDPRHVGNLEVFAEAGDEITGWIEERLQAATEIGLPYPYDALTLVEAPVGLRAFTGGWRLDTALAPPSMLLMKESSFPTARFDNRFNVLDDDKDFASQEGGLPRAKRDALAKFFEGDFNGGNIFLGAARNFFLYQTASQGRGSMALDFVCHDLTNRLITDKQGFFTAHIFGANFQQTIQSVIIGFMTGEGLSITDAVMQSITDRPEVWEQALEVSLADMDPWEEPERTVNVLALKGDAMSRWLLDGLGRAKAGELLANLRARSAGRAFNRDDLQAVADELGIDFDSLAGAWLTTTELPGIIASEARFFRLADSAEGSPRYQVAVHLRNDEAVPGLLRLRYDLPSDEEVGKSNINVTVNGQSQSRRRGNWQESDPVRLGAGEAVEMGLVLSKPPLEVRVQPYLSLNRGAFTVSLPSLDEEKIVEAEPFIGVRPSEWRQVTGKVIVVDDLDPGFSVVADAKSSRFRLGAKAKDENLDQGLPVGDGVQPPRQWSRWPMKTGWGKYRRTVAAVVKGKGQRRVIFAADIPKSGAWRLELHMPPSRALRFRQGTYHLTVEDTSGSQELTFDAGAAEEGWNMLGELEIASGEARVALSDETDGRVIFADAIRWRPVGSSQDPEPSDAGQEEGDD